MKAFRDVIAVLVIILGLGGAVGVITNKIDRNMIAIVFTGLILGYLLVRFLWERAKREKPLIKPPSVLDFSKARDRIQSRMPPSHPGGSDKGKLTEKIERRKQEWETRGKDQYQRRRGLAEDEEEK